MSVSRPARGVAFVLVTAIAAVTLASVTAALADDHMAVASLGNGAVDLVWIPEHNNWPAGGWQLDRVTAAGETTIAAHIGPGLDRAAMSALTADEANGIADFASKLAGGTLTDDERGAADTVLVIAAITHPEYGHALGLRFRDTGVPAGDTRYRLTALDAVGRPLRSVESDPVDPATPTPLPFAPEQVAVDVTSDGFVLSWAEPQNVDAAPIVGYRVTRVDGASEADLTPDLVLRAAKGAGNDQSGRLTFVDRDPIRDHPTTYAIASIDLFGRASTPKRVPVSLGDLARAVVPAGVGVTPGTNSATITWSPVTQPGVSGYVVERSLFIAGPYEALTPDGLPPDATRFESDGLSPATSYFFRVRVFDGDGNLGKPSLPVKTTPLAAGPPAAPQNLAADVGVTRVALTWNEADTPAAAGFFIFRRLDGQETWMQLNDTITQEPMFYDRFERGAFNRAKVFYRVQAVGYDNQRSAFSDDVAVTFGDVVPPAPPVISSVNGDNGLARLDFAPAAPEEGSTGFVVLRADDERRPGTPIGDVLPGTARAYDDRDAAAGSTHWYEVVAIDDAGNRSDLSNRVAITVAAPDLPSPPEAPGDVPCHPVPLCRAHRRRAAGEHPGDGRGARARQVGGGRRPARRSHHDQPHRPSGRRRHRRLPRVLPGCERRTRRPVAGSHRRPKVTGAACGHPEARDRTWSRVRESRCGILIGLPVRSEPAVRVRARAGRPVAPARARPVPEVLPVRRVAAALVELALMAAAAPGFRY